MRGHTHLRLLMAALVGMVAVGASLWPSSTPVQAAGVTVVIPGDSYLPPAVVIEAGQTVTWVNKDSDPHVTVSVPGVPEAFTIPNFPGKSASVTFTKPGVYPYYCVDHATYNTRLGRTVARKEADLFPIAMEGLIVVKGPGFVGTPTATVKISGGSYAPDIAVVQAGGQVTWTNGTNETHAVMVVGADGPKLELPAGGSQTATFAKPGTYFFYCPLHAIYDSKVGLAAAKKGTATFPVAEEGFVVVL